MNEFTERYRKDHDAMMAALDASRDVPISLFKNQLEMAIKALEITAGMLAPGSNELRRIIRLIVLLKLKLE